VSNSVDAIVTEDLCKVYRSHLGRVASRPLQGLNLQVHENEVFGFLGRNGAGKTTTIKLLCSLIKPTSGKALVRGENAHSRRARRWIGYLPENPYFYEYLTPRETIDFYGRLHGLEAAKRRDEWDKLAPLLDLERIADQRVRGFSKGMRQRLGFAVALVGDPPIVILDEPMSGLDPLGRRMIRERILDLREAGKTVFFSSHVLGDVEQICDRVGILVQGNLTATGRIDELVDRQVARVEVIATGLSEEAVKELAKDALDHRESDAGHHFEYADGEAANSAAQAIHKANGAIVEFTPVKESLEDYFMRQQEGAS
jgi:ABC-2 type transport system ATP-binding protein